MKSWLPVLLGLVAACSVERGQDSTTCRRDPCASDCDRSFVNRSCASDAADERMCQNCERRDAGDFPANDAETEFDPAPVLDGAMVVDPGTERDAETVDSAQSPQCLEDADCPALAPVCSAGQCGRCSPAANQCKDRPATPICDPASGACVECLWPYYQDCGESKVCGGTTCVDCVYASDCEKERPHCSADNECGRCIADADCSRFGNICDVDSGQCVQCTEAKPFLCLDSQCDALEHTCAAGVAPPRVALCEPCVSDQDCGPPGALCSRQNESTRLFYCLPTSDAGCLDHNVFTQLVWNARGHPLPSIDRVLTFTCSPSVLCPAYRDFMAGKACTGAEDDSCGAAGDYPGVCAKVPGQAAFRCSIRCSGPRDCPEGVACTDENHCAVQ